MKVPPKGYSVLVTCTFEVDLWYADGIHLCSETEDEAVTELLDRVGLDAVEAVLEGDLIVTKYHVETESYNGYVASVDMFEPQAKIRYNTDSVPKGLSEKISEITNG